MGKEIVGLLRKQNELLGLILERLTYIDESTNKDRARGFGRAEVVMMYATQRHP